MQLQLPVLLALVTFAVAFPKWDKKVDKGDDGKWDDKDGKDWDGKDGKSWDGKDGKSWDGKDGDTQPWDPSHHGKNQTLCISIPQGGSWSVVGPDGNKHSFDDLKWDSGSSGSDGSSGGGY